MDILLNLIIALIVGFLTDYILGGFGIANPLKVLIAVLVGLLVFFYISPF